MDEQEVLISLENLQDYHKGLLDQLPKEQIWIGVGDPNEAETEEEQIFGADYQNGNFYYRLGAGTAWNLLTLNEKDEVETRIEIEAKDSNNNSLDEVYLSGEDKEFKIKFNWKCFTIDDTEDGTVETPIRTKGTIEIYVGGGLKETFKEYSYTDKRQTTIERDLMSYLQAGVNNIEIRITNAFGVTQSFFFNINIIVLTLIRTTYEQNSIQYQDDKKLDGVTSIKPTIYINGTGGKEIHVLINGEEKNKPFEIPANTENFTIEIPRFEEDGSYCHGSYFVEVYATSTINKKVKSNSLCFDFIWVDNVTPQSTAIIASPFSRTEASQYEKLRIPFFIYRGGGYSHCLTRFSVIRKYIRDGEEVFEEISSTEPQNYQVEKPLEWEVSYNEEMNKNEVHMVHFKIEIGVLEENGEEFIFKKQDEKDYAINIKHTAIPDISIKGEKLDSMSKLGINFMVEKTAIDNTSSTRDIWESKGKCTGSNGKKLSAEFSDFDWINGGWQTIDDRSALQLTNGSKLKIPYKIFEQNNIDGTDTKFNKVGLTIELDVSFSGVTDYTTPFFTCFYEKTGKGIKVSPSKAIFSNGIKTAISQYESSKSKHYSNSMHFTFVITPEQERTVTDEDGKTSTTLLGGMYIYINGVGAAAAEYSRSPEDTINQFSHTQEIFFDSTGCTVNLFGFRMYYQNLTTFEILNNWIADMTPSNKIEAYSQNWIFNEQTYEVDRDKAIKQIPCMTIIGEMPAYKTNKKTVDIEFSGTKDKLFDFSLAKAQIDVQGTSSQYYPVKNWKFKRKGADFTFPKELGKKAASTYALNDDQIPSSVFCLKADYMETSSTHNTVTANIANSMYDNEDYGKTPPQKQDKTGRVRTTIYGRPILVFYQLNRSEAPVFGGKYNFNYDKDSEEVFGFIPPEKGTPEYQNFEVIECVEFKENRDAKDLLQEKMFNPTADNPNDTVWIDLAEKESYDERDILDTRTRTEGDTVYNEILIPKWAKAFEFRAYQRKEDDGTTETRRAYLQAVTDWVYELNKDTATNELLPEDKQVPFEEGTAYYEYDLDMNKVTFKYAPLKLGLIDTDKPTRYSLDLQGEDPEDFKYIIEKYYGVQYLDPSTKKVIKVDAYSEEEWKNVDIEETETIKFRIYYALPWLPNEGFIEEDPSTYQNYKNGKEVYYFKTDSKEYRLSRFKSEFSEHFNEHFCLMYYLLMEMLGMVDSSTKNMFWATWGERHEKHPIENGDKVVIWYPIFYDMDTMLGIDNVGKMEIPYNVEYDTVLSNGEHAYNGYGNVFWENFREAFVVELNETFRKKIDDGTFRLDTILNQYENHSKNFCEFIYNEDGDLKILDKYFKGHEVNIAGKITKEYADWMHVYQGDRYYYRNFWFPNRFNYICSKNRAGSYVDDYISMRLNDPRLTYDPNADVNYDFDEIETWTDQYVRIKYGGFSIGKRFYANTPDGISSPQNSYNDTETAIYGASNLKRIGSLAKKYANSIKLEKASRLLSFSAGSEDDNYENYSLEEINFGNNSMLETVNLSNCKALNTEINLSSCSSIKEVLLKNTQVKRVILPSPGKLKTLILPNTIQNLSIVNHPQLSIFEMPPQEKPYIENEEEKIEQYYDLDTLVIKGTPNIPTRELVEKSINKNLRYLSLTDINWELVNGDLLIAIMEKGQLVDEENKLIGDGFEERPVLHGECIVNSMAEPMIKKINEYFNGLKEDETLPPNNERQFRLTVYNPIKAHTVLFKDWNGELIPSGILGDYIVHEQPVAFKEKNPEREQEWDRTYSFAGWQAYYHDDKKTEDGIFVGKNGNFYNSNGEEIKVTQDITFTATYTTIYKEFKYEFEYTNPNDSSDTEITIYPFTTENTPDLITEQEVPIYKNITYAPNTNDNWGYYFYGWMDKYRKPVYYKGEKITLPDLSDDPTKWSDEENYTFRYKSYFGASEKIFSISFIDRNGNYLDYIDDDNNKIKYENLVFFSDKSDIIDIPEKEKRESIIKLPFFPEENENEENGIKQWKDSNYIYNLYGWAYESYGGDTSFEGEPSDDIKNNTLIKAIYSGNNISFDEVKIVKDIFKEEGKSYELTLKPIYKKTQRYYNIYFYKIKGGIGSDRYDYDLHNIVKYELNNIVTPPSNKDMDIYGYNFNTWKEGSSEGPDADFSEPVREDKHYYATYTLINYTITYNYYESNDSGTSGKAIKLEYQVPYGTPLSNTEYSPPIKVGDQYSIVSATYQCLGWTSSTDADTILTVLPVVTQDEVYTAKYDEGTLRTFTYKWYDEKGTLLATTTGTYSTSYGPVSPYDYGHILGTDRVILGFKNVPSKRIADGDFTATIGKLKTYNDSLNWSDTDKGISSAIHQNVSSMSPSGFTATSEPFEVLNSRKIGINTTKLVGDGEPRLIQKIVVSYKVSSASFTSFANTYLGGTNLVDHKTTKGISVGTSTSIEMSLSKNSKDYLGHSDGNQWIYFGFWDANAFQDGSVTYTNVSFKIIYIDQII